MLREGLLVVISGPSGTGKGTLLKMIQDVNSSARMSVSATTRQPREGEVDGKNYFFISVDAFKSMIDNGELVEWVKYCDNYYGTPRKYIEECKAKGLDVILEIEVEGACNIKSMFPDCISIFILPPSFDELKRRITLRGTEKEEVIEKRMEKARMEIECVDNYDYVVINDSVEKAASEITSILVSEKLRFSRNRNILKEIGI